MIEGDESIPIKQFVGVDTWFRVTPVGTVNIMDPPAGIRLSVVKVI